MDSSATPQLELLLALARHDVEFVVVGGVAAQIHGWQSATLDLDVAVSTEDANVERLNEALATSAPVSQRLARSEQASGPGTGVSRSCEWHTASAVTRIGAPLP
jgi:hypothetical protein